MRNDYVHISILLDRSGSMERIRNDIIGGFNTFLNPQKQHSGYATLSLTQFDLPNGGKPRFEEVYHFIPIQNVAELTTSTFIPRGNTPLFDALGESITKLGEHLSSMPEEVRPFKVIYVVITDGEENSSKKFSKQQILEMINHQIESYKWDFVFLSADPAAFREAQTLGFRSNQSMVYAANTIGVRTMYSSFGEATSKVRSGLKDSVTFTEEDRKKQKDAEKAPKVL
jgi:uncharacterized protein YegL